MQNTGSCVSRAFQLQKQPIFRHNIKGLITPLCCVECLSLSCDKLRLFRLGSVEKLQMEWPFIASVPRIKTPGEHMQYLWQFYLLLFVILVQGIILTFSKKIGKTVFLWLCFIELTFIAGFRAWDIGNDTLPYIRTFVRGGEGSYMEKGYLLYNQLLALFTSNPQILLLTNALLINRTICQFIKKYSSVVLFPILLFVLLFFGSTLNIMRQFLALSIILYALPFVIQRKFVPFAICCLLASSFHTSSLVALGLYWLYTLKFKWKYIILALVGTVLCAWLLAPILNKIIIATDRYTYVANLLAEDSLKMASFFKLGIDISVFIFCYFSYRIYGNKFSVSAVLPPRFLLWCSFITCCLQIVSIRATTLDRIPIYFSIFSLISIPMFVHCYPKKARLLLAFFIFLCFVLYKSMVFVYRPEWNHILPFGFCFN